jgi:hypothetical protein
MSLVLVFLVVVSLLMPYRETVGENKKEETEVAVFLTIADGGVVIHRDVNKFKNIFPEDMVILSLHEEEATAKFIGFFEMSSGVNEDILTPFKEVKKGDNQNE